MITAPLPRASPSGMGRLSLIIPRYYGLTVTYVIKKIVIERTRDLIYLKFVATDFSLKIISPSAGENSVDSALPLLFCSFWRLYFKIQCCSALLQDLVGNSVP